MRGVDPWARKWHGSLAGLVEEGQENDDAAIPPGDTVGVGEKRECSKRALCKPSLKRVGSGAAVKALTPLMLIYQPSVEVLNNYERYHVKLQSSYGRRINIGTSFKPTP